MSNFVQQFWQRKFDKNFIKDFELLPISENQQEAVLSSPEGYDQAVLDAANYGLAHGGVRIYDDESMREYLEEFWSSDEVSDELRIALGVEVFLISGIAEEMEATRLEEIEKSEREEVERLALEEAEMVAVVDGDSEEVQNLDPSVTIEEFAEDNLHAEQVTTHP